MTAIRRVAVLGAGTMGSRIAAHFANAGVPSLLLDVMIPGEADRNAAAARGLEAARKSRPPAFFDDSLSSLVTTGNFEDHLGAIAGCGWVLEAVTENLEIKRELWRRVAGVAAGDALLTTNTSGIPLARIAEAIPEQARPRFLGAHFFNPPRYLHLVEIIPGPDTDPAALQRVSDFCERRLGKGVVVCRDTPNFIANRLGGFFANTACRLALESGFPLEEADALTGAPIGLPNTATFRLIDLIGLDVWNSLLANVRELAPHDPWVESFRPPELLSRLVALGRLGNKSGAGFYRKDPRRGVLVIDPETLEYRPPARYAFSTAGETADRVKALIAAGGRAGALMWSLISEYLLYAAWLVPEVSPRVVEIDRAMRWGYAHQLGPFELWDALGFAATARRIAGEGRALPAPVERMLSHNAIGFYRHADAGGKPSTEYFDLPGVRYRALEERPGVIVLSDLKRARNVVSSSEAATLVDLWDGALCLELHSAPGPAWFVPIEQALAETLKNFETLVLAGCRGDDREWYRTAGPEDLDEAVRRWREIAIAVKYSHKPVVAALSGQTLGSACALALHCHRIQASAELSMGFGANLGWGMEALPPRGGAPRWEDVAASAYEARRMGLLRDGDGITMNPERLLADARRTALAIAAWYVPGGPEPAIPGLPGKSA